MAAAVECGLTPDEFWNATLRELEILGRARRSREAASYRRAAWTAWHVAALMRVGAEFPPLAEFLEPPRAPTAEEEAERARDHAEMLELRRRMKENRDG
jgi:hypothetical protein